MIATLPFVMLLLAAAPATAAQSAQPLCQTFTREAVAAPPLVRAWLASSGDQRVRICPQPGPPAGETMYFGEGAVSQHALVCSYPSYGLAIVGSGTTRRLRRMERTEAVAMALADHECPAPHADSGPDVYVLTYDISPRAFAAIMALWLQFSAAGLPPNAQQSPHVCCHLSAKSAAAPGDAATAATLKRLHAASQDGRLKASDVMRIVRMPGSTLRHRYALFVKDPDKVRAVGQPGMYVIYVQKRLRGPYEVSDVGESN